MSYTERDIRNVESLRGRSALKGTHEAPGVPFKLPSLPPLPRALPTLPTIGADEMELFYELT